MSGTHGGGYADCCLLGSSACSLVDVYRRFRRMCCLHCQDIAASTSRRRPKDGGSKHIWNVGKLLPDCRWNNPEDNHLQAKWSRPPFYIDLSWKKYFSLSCHICKHIRTSSLDQSCNAALWQNLITVHGSHEWVLNGKMLVLMVWVTY
jgi:hypothetical protein